MRAMPFSSMPVEHRGRAISGVGGEQLGPQTEALLGTLDHGKRGTDLGLADGPQGLHVDNDAAFRSIR